ncbi:MAG TPA: OmpA family protein [Chitinophagaceae bacterium]
MKKRLQYIGLMAVAVMMVMSSCVSGKKYKESQAALAEARQKNRGDSTWNATQLSNLDKNIQELEQRKARLQQQIDSLNNEVNNANKTAANQQGLLSEQQKRIDYLQSLIDQQRKTTNELKEKISNALTSFSASDLTVSEKNGKVYVSLSENLLFPSGSAVVNKNGISALEKLAEVLNNNPDININIEGHTDTVPIRGRYEDNWALSVARATSIVRILTQKYKVDPVRIIASGHSQYDPVDTNSTADGRAHNRRTEIILIPKLDELYRLIEQGG